MTPPVAAENVAAMRLALSTALILLALAACETGPRQRVVRGEFACDDGRKLRVAFNLDAGSAEVRVEKSKTPPVLLSHQPGVAGRNYAAEGYSLNGVGDRITYATPAAPAARCVETPLSPAAIGAGSRSSLRRTGVIGCSSCAPFAPPPSP